MFNRRDTSSNGCFFIVMSVFGDVYVVDICCITMSPWDFYTTFTVLQVTFPSNLKMNNIKYIFQPSTQKASFLNFQAISKGSSNRKTLQDFKAWQKTLGLDNHWWHSMHHTCSDRRLWPFHKNHQIRYVPIPSWQGGALAPPENNIVFTSGPMWWLCVFLS